MGQVPSYVPADPNGVDVEVDQVLTLILSLGSCRVGSPASSPCAHYEAERCNIISTNSTLVAMTKR